MVREDAALSCLQSQAADICRVGNIAGSDGVGVNAQLSCDDIAIGHRECASRSRCVFTGAQALSCAGLLESNPALLQGERRLIAKASGLIVLADSSKFNSMVHLASLPIGGSQICSTRASESRLAHPVIVGGTLRVPGGALNSSFDAVPRGRPLDRRCLSGE